MHIHTCSHQLELSRMHVAFLITWAFPPAAREAHLGAERSVHAESKGGVEGGVLMSGVSGTCLMVTFLHQAGGLSVKSRPSPWAPFQPLGPLILR